MPMVESRSVSLSIVLHAIALLVAAFGLPVLLPEKPEPMPIVMTVELLPITGITNVKPSDAPITKEQKAPTPKTPKPVTPSITEKPIEPPNKKFDPTAGAEPLPSDTPKPIEKPKEKEAEKPKPDEFAALLNQLKQEAKTDTSKDAKDTTNTPENKTKSDAPYDASLPLSLSETDAIRSQFIPCWRMPAGAKDPQSLAVSVKVKLQPDGTVLEAVLDPALRGRYSSDPFFRAAADSALRATHQCSPLKNLPPEKYNTWREMTINFSPQDLL